MSASIEWLVWQANEINRSILENRIWNGEYAAECIKANQDSRFATIRQSIRAAIESDPSLSRLIDECANAYVSACNAHAVAGIRVAV